MPGGHSTRCVCCEGVREGMCEGEWRGGIEVGCVRGERLGGEAWEYCNNDE